MIIKGKDNQDYEIDEKMIFCNNVTFPFESNPHKTGLYVIGHEYGSFCAIWADNEQEAFDEMVDKDIEIFLVDEEDLRDYDFENNPNGYFFLGNAGEACNLDYAWVEKIDLNKQDIKLLLKFAEARGACADTTYDV